MFTDMSKRIHFNRYKGDKLPPEAILVNRSSRWGNPYKVSEYGRAEALRLYRIYLEDKLREEPGYLLPLIGKDIACNCALSEDCHGDILLEKIREIYG